MGFEQVQKAFERQAIEIAPLAFMRGRTLNNAFVILDEAQNTTPEQMKMFLTRIGFGAKAVVTGDVSQIDLPKTQLSGLIDAERVLKRVTGIAICRLTSADVVRHPLVARIVDAYDAPGRTADRAMTTRLHLAPPGRPDAQALRRKHPNEPLSLSLQFGKSLKAAPHRAALPRHKVDALDSPCAASDAEITVRIVDADEGQALNRDYRQKDYATNVLTFDYTQEPVVMADLVLCAPVVAREAKEQSKTLEAHYAHLLVHGTLHAQGWDHDEDEDAEDMEVREIEILAGLGFANPY